ncbi:MAG: NADPH-dependent FMN reductase [Pseudomonadota bacterium]|jgi:chromate reductase|nr:NAD(P)H-dependent oxidoreductase [Alphaproteobacteria bacterium]
MQYLFLSGSLRKESLNTQLLQLAAKHTGSPLSAIVDLNQYNIPLYSGDIEAVGIPDGVQKLSQKIEQAQAIIIASPEYNYSISGVLKNTIDWVSRVRPMPFRKKPILLLAASMGPIAGIRGLWQTRIPLEGLGNYVYPDMFSLGVAHEALNEEGFTNPDDQKRFATTLDGFSEFAKRFS